MGTKRPIIAITTGDPAGIGPEVTIKALMGHIKKRAADRPRPEARPAVEPARPGAEAKPEARPAARPEARPADDSLPESPGKKMPEDKSGIPIPKVIKADGPLSDAARIFIEKKLIPDLIKRTYCPGGK